MRTRSSLIRRLIAMAIGTLILAAFGTSISFAQDAPAALSADDLTPINIAIDSTWVMIAAFLVFFMQAGFAMLETGLVRQTGAVNALAVNFIDATVTGIVFWFVGFGIAFGASSNGLFGTSMFALNSSSMGEIFYGNLPVLVFFFFQFAFAATAATITTGALAERTDFIGDQLKSVAIGALIYPVVVHWHWGGGWLFQTGFHDFAGSTLVHYVGGLCALVGAAIMGPRPGRKWGAPPKPHNLGLAALGAMILWFGWYGFNPGSTLGIIGYADLAALIALNTTLAAAIGTLSTLAFVYFRTHKFDFAMSLNGSLAGLVGVTAGCAFVEPIGALAIGAVAGVVVVLAADLVESLKIDDAVGAFAVHGACGMWGTLAIGLFGAPGLMLAVPGTETVNLGLFYGGGLSMLGIQFVGVAATTLWVGATSAVLFFGLKAIGRLRVNKIADTVGIDVYEHGASIWPDVAPLPEEIDGSAKSIPAGATQPAGD
ncbi:MAG: ammonium transporter [Anaerolineae bacterium]|jgi:Amt family ammonium transporter|nr:ammonium transporter [Anaerolineae bacterium]